MKSIQRFINKITVAVFGLFIDLNKLQYHLNSKTAAVLRDYIIHSRMRNGLCRDLANAWVAEQPF